MRADGAFTARATSLFGLDRLYRVYASGNQLVFIRIGGQGGVAQGIASQFGLLGGLLLAAWQKRSRKQRELRVAADAAEDPRVLLGRDRRNFALDVGQIARATIEPPSRMAAHGPHHGVWRFEETRGKKHTLQFEELPEMQAALAILPALLGPSLTVKAAWNERKGRFVRAEAVGTP